MIGYHLETVPQPPSNGMWLDKLRWLCAVMDNDDPDLAFACGLLENCLKFDGLTERQARYAGKISKRIEAHFDAGILAAQQREIDA